MNAKKTAILLALVLLGFGAVLIYAVTRDDSDAQASDGHWYTKAIDSLFGEKRVLSPADVMGECLSGSTFHVRPSNPCTVRLRTSDTAMRGFRLALVSGLKARIELRPKGTSGIPVRVPLRSQVPQTPNLQVLEDGSDLTLECEQAMDPVAGCLISLAAPK